MLSAVLSGTGFSSESVVFGWVLLDKTDSTIAVGFGLALRFLPNFLLGIPAGAIVDRSDRRAVLAASGLGAAVNASILAALAFAGALEVWHVLLCIVITGSIGALGQAARQSYAFDIVGKEQALGGIAMMTLAQRGGGIIGALGSGLVLKELGVGEAYAGMAFFYLLSALVISFARTRGQAAPASRPAILSGIKEYLGELRVNRTLFLLVALTGAVEIFGFSHLAVMPSIARDVLDAGPEGLGLLSASAATGGTLAVLAVSVRGDIRKRGPAFLAVLLLFGGALLFLSASQSLALAMVAMACVSSLASLSDLLSQTLVQTAVANDLRGRAMGSWLLAIGLAPVGHIQIGVLAALVGASLALAANAVALILMTLVVLLTARELRRL
jgi:MFS family permease